MRDRENPRPPGSQLKWTSASLARPLAFRAGRLAPPRLTCFCARRPCGAGKITRARQISLDKHGDDRNRAILCFQHANAVLGRERRFSLGAPVENAEQTDALAATRHVAGTLTNKPLAVGQPQALLIHGFEFDADSLRCQ